MRARLPGSEGADIVMAVPPLTFPHEGGREFTFLPVGVGGLDALRCESLPLLSASPLTPGEGAFRTLSEPGRSRGTARLDVRSTLNSPRAC